MKNCISVRFSRSVRMTLASFRRLLSYASHISTRRSRLVDLGRDLGRHSGSGMQWAYASTRFLVDERAIPRILQDRRVRELENGGKISDVFIGVAGRVLSVRRSGKKVVFADVLCGASGAKIQMVVISSGNELSEQGRIAREIQRGDIIGMRGIVGKTKAGEVSIYPSELEILAPCLHDIPEKLEDTNTRFRQRYLDLLVNRETVLQRMVKRSQIISELRKQLVSELGFLEVETPILWNEFGGAHARPFITHSNAMEMELKLRIAPELFLKQLVIGGMGKVFEIGKVFRNEGLDPSHNPEFTICEIYQSFTDYEGMVSLVELIFQNLEEKFGPVSFLRPPFKRIDIVQGLKEQLALRGASFPDGLDLNSPQSLGALVGLCKSLGIVIDGPLTNARVLDKLIGELLEPLCDSPTFLMHHPECMSPLAKRKQEPSEFGSVTERFELFIQGKEICNGYSELNDPDDQRSRFLNQSRDIAAGDEETSPPDENFCEALEYGLAPTGGLGIGIDRLVMLLTDQRQIREVLAFPLIRKSEQ